MPHTHGLSLIWALLFLIPAGMMWWAYPTNRRAPMIYLAIAFAVTIVTWYASRTQWFLLDG